MSDTKQQQYEEFPEGSPDEGRATWYLIDFKKAMFTHRENNADQFTPNAKGYFSELWLQWFEGSGSEDNPQSYVAPRYEANIGLTTKDGERIVVKCSTPVPYYCLAGKLEAIKEGDPIWIQLEPLGNTVSVSVFKSVAKEWMLVKGGAIDKVDVPLKIRQGTSRFFAHPNYSTGKEITGPDGGVRAFRGDPSDTPASTSAAATTEQQPVRQTNSHPEQAADKPAIERTAFGRVAKIWPSQEMFGMAPTVSQIKVFSEQTTALFGGVRIKAECVAEEILKAYGLPRKAFDTYDKARYGIVLEFLLHADEAQMEAALHASNPVSDEYDPFA